MANTYRRRPRIAARVVAGQAAVVSLDDNKLHILNAVGTHVWTLLDHPRDEGFLVEALIERFDVSREQAQADCSEFCGELVERRLVEVL
jgi:hypothetical protein